MNEYIKKYSNGSKHYYKDKAMTILHRVDGPAIEYADGDKSWFINGVYIFEISGSGNIFKKTH